MKAIISAAVVAAVLGATPAGAQQSAPAKEFARHPGPSDLVRDRIEHVTGDVSTAIGVWSGVRSCGEASRAESARQAAYERWIGQQTLARPHKLLLDAGVGPGQWHYENRKRHGVRSCKGMYDLAPVYANFY